MALHPPNNVFFFYFVFMSRIIVKTTCNPLITVSNVNHLSHELMNLFENLTLVNKGNKPNSNTQAATTHKA